MTEMWEKAHRKRRWTVSTLASKSGRGDSTLPQLHDIAKVLVFSYRCSRYFRFPLNQYRIIALKWMQPSEQTRGQHFYA